jgi:two-component system, NtrC family, response regulator HydG
LRNALESMAVLAAGEELTMEDLPATLLDAPNSGGDVNIPAGMSLDDIEREAIEQALAQHEGNRTHAAADLGISVRTLQRKLKAWGWDEEEP